MSAEMPHVGVIGAGAWGTALAILANRAGSKATLWTRNTQVVESIKSRRVGAGHFIRGWTLKQVQGDKVVA